MINRYVIRISIAVLIGAVLVIGASEAEHETWQSMLVGAPYYIGCFAFVWMLPGLIAEMFFKCGMFANEKVRFYGVPLFGAIIGLFVMLQGVLLPWDEYSNGIGDRFAELRSSLPDKLAPQCGELLDKLDLLRSCQLFVDNFGLAVSIGACLAALVVFIADRWRSPWTLRALACGYLVAAIPTVIVSELSYPSFQVDHHMFWQTMLAIHWTSVLFGVGLVPFTGIVRFPLIRKLMGCAE